MANVTIDGFLLKTPSTISYGTYRISKSGRLASGLMTMDIIAIKRRIDLVWNSLSGAHLSDIIAMLDAKTFYTITFPDSKVAGGIATMTAYVGDVNLDLFRSDGSRIWKDVKLPFIEQ